MYLNLNKFNIFFT